MDDNRVILEVGFAGKTYEYDPDSLLVSEFRQIKKVTGLSRKGWYEGLNDDDPDAVAALIYILRRRTGEDVRFADIDGEWSSLTITRQGGAEEEEPEGEGKAEAPDDAAGS